MSDLTYQSLEPIDKEQFVSAMASKDSSQQAIAVLRASYHGVEPKLVETRCYSALANRENLILMHAAIVAISHLARRRDLDNPNAAVDLLSMFLDDTTLAGNAADTIGDIKLFNAGYF